MSTITIEMVGQLAKDFFQTEDYDRDHEGTVTLNLICHGCYTAVYIDLEDEPESEQIIQINYTFDSSVSPLINLQHINWLALLEICHELQRSLNWGTIMPERVGDGYEANLVLYRRVHINELTVTTRNADSEFRNILEQLTYEWEVLAPIVHGITTLQVASLTDINALMEPGGGEA